MTRSENGTINVEEQRELTHSEGIEHIIRRAKAHAWKYAGGNDYISRATGRKVGERTGFRCEYCLFAERVIDHIISLKYKGTNSIDNLAWLSKGSDVGYITPDTHEFIRFYTPGTDIRSEHFQLVNFRIEPISDIGVVTEFIFGFNESEHATERSVSF